MDGHSQLNGLVVLPAITLWGGVVGEWLAHRWIARGLDTSKLIRHFLLGAATSIAWLVISAWFLRFPPAEMDEVRRKCHASYARARTAADSARIARWEPTVNGRPGPGTCPPPDR
jgi:hypothetical protein